MPDVGGPNKKLNRMRLELQVAEMQLSMKRMNVRRAEMDEEIERLDINTTATKKAIADLEAQLKQLGD